MSSETRILTEREEQILRYFDRYMAQTKNFTEFLYGVMEKFLPYLPEEERQAIDIIINHCSMPTFDDWMEHERFHEKLEWDKYMCDMPKGEPDEVRRRFEVMMQNFEARKAHGEVKDVICAENEIELIAVAALEGHRLLAEFATGEFRIYSMEPLLELPVFAPLKDETLFRTVKLTDGAPVWLDGKVDIAPETIYEQGEQVNWQM